MVTGSTFKKAHHFRNPSRLDWFTSTMITTLEEFGWAIQAWSVFSKHYHLIAAQPERPESLQEAMQKLHSLAAIHANELDGTVGRQVMYQYWETFLSFERSYLARLNYVISNPVKHGLVGEATDYRWCSAAWFEKSCPSSFVRTVRSFKTDKLKILDDFDVILEED